MQDKSNGRLLEYLRDIMEDSQAEYLDVEELDESCRELGCGLRELHKNLNHFARQTELAAKGDYTLCTVHLGGLTGAFNEMLQQAEKRESQLKEEIIRAKHQMELIESDYNLMVGLLGRRDEWIVVVDIETGDVLYCNKREYEGNVENEYCIACKNRLSFHSELLKWKVEEQYKVWEINDGLGTYYRITSFRIEWRGRESCVHFVTDITEEKQAVHSLTSKAYHDPGTGIRNRLFFEEYMELVLTEKREVTLCYLDLDGLKYVNDTYGHQEGDIYIQNFVEFIRSNFRSGDTFARIGGDEFCLVLTGNFSKLLGRKIKEILCEFQEENLAEYRCSFSYGIVEINGKANEMSYEEILQKADERMYECKKRNKEKYPELIR